MPLHCLHPVNIMQVKSAYIHINGKQFKTLASSHTVCAVCGITMRKCVDSSADGKEESLVIINVYCPRADLSNDERLSFKLQFNRLLQCRAEALLNRGRHVFVLVVIHVFSAYIFNL
jgi:exonuclease III